MSEDTRPSELFAKTVVLEGLKNVSVLESANSMDCLVSRMLQLTRVFDFLFSSGNLLLL